MGVKPLLQFRLSPGLVQPVAGVGSGLAELLGYGVVARACLLKDGVTLARLRNYTSRVNVCPESSESEAGCAGLPGIPCLSQKALSWLSVQVSRIQSRTLAQAVCAFSSVSYQLERTWLTRLSFVASASASACFPLAWR